MGSQTLNDILRTVALGGNNNTPSVSGSGQGFAFFVVPLKARSQSVGPGVLKFTAESELLSG